MFKKITIAAAVLGLALFFTGCGTKTPAPAPTPKETAQEQPQAHPTETPVQPGSTGKVDPAQIEGKINDIFKSKYPGDWKVSGSTLSKGNYTENNNYKIVDDIAAAFPNTMGVSIFVGEERISSSVKQGDQRVLQGYPTPPTVGEVMKSGKLTSTQSSGYLKVYLPLQDKGKKTVAVLTVSVPEQ